MPTDDRFIDIPLGGGLAQKQDPRLITPGGVTGLINGTFDKVGTIKKRPGNAVNSLTTLAGNPLPPVQQLMTFGDQLLAIPYTGNPLSVLAQNSEQWVSGSVVLPTQFVAECSARRNAVPQFGTNVAGPQSCYVNGLIVYAWLNNASTTVTRTNAVLNDSFGQATVMVVDATTGAIMLQPTSLSAQAARAIRVTAIANSNNAVVTWVSTNATQLFTAMISCGFSIPTLSNTIGSSSITMQTSQYDACSDGTRLYAVLSAGAPGSVVAYKPTVFSCNFPTTVELLTGSIVNVGDDNSMGAIACAVTSTFAQPTLMQLMGAISYGFAAAPGIFVDAQAWAYNTLTNTFPTVSARTHLSSSNFDGIQLAAPSLGVAWRDTFNACFTWSMLLNVPGLSGSFATQGLGTTLSVASLGFWNGGGGALISTGSQTRQWFAHVISKPWLIPDTTVAAGNSFNLPAVPSRAYVLAYDDVYTLQQASGSFSTVRCYDLNLELSGSPQWRPCATVLPRQFFVNSIPFASSTFMPNGVVTSVWSDSPLTFNAAVPAVAGQGIAYPPDQGFQNVELDFNPLTQYGSVTGGDNLHVACGTPTFWDGANTGDIGFAYYPPMQQSYFVPQTGSVHTIGLGGAGMAPGTYVYYFTYEYVDSQGQVHQSAPSIGNSVTIVDPSGGTHATGSVQVYIPNLCIGARNVFPAISPSNFPYVAVYRTTANGTIPYRLTPLPSPGPGNAAGSLICNPQNPALYWTDLTGDQFVSASGGPLNTQPIMYTVGGVLPYFSPPSAKHIVQWQGSLWLAGTDDPKAVWWSNALAPGLAASFDDAFQLRVDDGEDITALQPMDSNLIIFKSDRIFYITGQQPGPTGQNGNLSSPIAIPSDVGCTNARSVVLIPKGILFQSDVGISMLDRSNNVTSNFGSAITDTLQQFPTITSAVIHPTMSQVRFTCGPTTFGAIAGDPAGLTRGAVIVYDYLVDQWSVFYLLNNTFTQAFPSSAPSYFLTGTMPMSAIVYNGDYVWADSWNAFGPQASVLPQGLVWTEGANVDTVVGITTSDNFTDGNTYVPMQVETAWMATSGIQGFQRAKRVHVLANAYDHCDVWLSYGIDYSPNYSTPWVESFGAAAGRPVPNASVRAHIGTQKCESIRFKVVDYQVSDGSGFYSGQGTSLARIGVLAGTKRGGQKLPPGRSF